MPVVVQDVATLGARLVSVRVTGADGALDGFASAAPTSHIKVFLPRPGQAEPVLPQAGPDGLIWPDGPDRPVVRTYTPRRYDPVLGLEIQFVLHGEGPASGWAGQARTGDRLAVAGPGGRFTLDPEVTRWWIGGDESALPAIGTLLDALPSDARAEVHVEVDGPDDEIVPSDRPGLEVAWHRRGTGGYGAAIEQAAGRADLPGGTHVWVGCEAAAVRRVRRHLLGERHLAVGAVTTRGYWRLGESDHPDGDYGDD